MNDMIGYIRKDPYIKVLLVVLVGAAVLRLYGLRNAENTDEYNEVVEALRVASGRFNLNRWHKKGFQNILAVLYGCYFIIGYLFELFKSPMDFASKVVGNMEPLLLIGRYATAIMGTLSVGLLYAVGRRLYNGRVGVMAALMLAVSSMHVWTSHLVNTDVPLTFFFLAALYYIARFTASGNRWDYGAAAFFCAVTINIKLTGVGIGVLFLAAHLMRAREQGKRLIGSLFSKDMGYAALAFLAGLVVSNPPLVLGLKKFIEYHYGVYTNVYDEVPYAVEGNAFFTYAVLLYREFGPVLSLLSLAGLAFALVKREAWDVVLLVFIAALYLALANTTFLVQNRYLMTMLPVLFLLNARLLDVLARLLPRGGKAAMGLIALCGVVLYYPATNSVAYVRTLAEENTSMASKKWIEANIPQGSKLLVDAGKTMITSGPRLNQSRKNLEDKLKVIRELKDGQTYDSPLVRIVDSYSAIYFELLLRNMPEITYDITTTELGRNVRIAEYYERNGYDYYVHDGDLEFRIEEPLWRSKYPESAEFYEHYASRFTLIQAFYPSPTRSGSPILIYRIP